MARLGHMLGMPLMPWQRYVADVALEVDPATGWWAYDEVGFTVQRRAGKSALAQTVQTHRLAMLKRARLLMSAQSGLKALERWNDTRELLEHSELSGKMRGYTSIGHERIVWKPTGSKLVPFAPDGDFVHGDELHGLFLDELWWYDAVAALKMKGGYRPAFLTANAQAWLYSTAGTLASAWLNDLRRTGRELVDRDVRRGTAYFEWSMPELIDVGGGQLVPWEDVEDDELIIAAALEAHPAIGQHPRVPAERMRELIIADLSDMGRAEWVRAYGNLTANGDGHRLFPEAIISGAIDPRRFPADAELQLALDVDPDRRDAALYAGWRDTGGRVRIEQIAYEQGTRWAAARAIANAELCGNRVMAINVGAARDVADEIERGGVTVARVSATDWAAACARTHDELKAPAGTTFLHRGDAEFIEAAGHVGWRTLGAGRAFTSTDGESITAFTGGTLAAWAADHPAEIEKPPPRSAVY